jgi:glycosyltransferase involved in cell wall biosynthesis
VCLGIFGDTKKAERVIPNKVFQILAAGRSLITRDSPAIRELLHPTRGIRLIAPAQPQALAAAVRAQLNHRSDIGVAERHRIIARISPSAVGRQLIAEVVQTVAR